MPKAKINYPLAVTLLATGATFNEIAPQVGAKSGESIRVGLLRYGVQKRDMIRLPVAEERITNTVQRVAIQAGLRVRENLSTVLERETESIAKRKASKSLRQASNIAAVIEPLARTAKVVYGWGDDDKVGVVVVGNMTQAEEPAIEVQSSPVQIPEENK